MSLNYDLRDIPDSVKIVVATEDSPSDGIRVGDELLNPITKTLIFSTMSLGIGVISEKTLDEFASRLKLYQALYGALARQWDDEAEEWVDRPLTREDVAAHIGLKTNVFPLETRAKWLKRITDREFFTSPCPKTQ